VLEDYLISVNCDLNGGQGFSLLMTTLPRPVSSGLARF